MKKVFLLFVSIAMIGLTSCSKDDKVVKDELANTIWIAKTTDLDVTLTFFDNKKFNLIVNSNIEEEQINADGMYVLSGKNITLKPTNEEGSVTGTLISSNKMTLVGGGDKVTLTKKQ